MDWSRYVDHAYCFTYLGGDDPLGKVSRLNAELDRVGLGDPGFTTRVYTTKDPWEKVLIDTGKIRPRTTEEESNRGFVNLGLASARTLREALALGYRRVLFLEDDIAFLNDVPTIERYMENLPAHGVVLLDMFTDWKWTPDDFRKYADEHSVNECFFESVMPEQDLKSGAMFVIDRDEMRRFLARLEDPADGPRPMDGFFPGVGVKAASKMHLGVQVAFGDAMMFKYMGRCHENTHHKGYGHGVDYSLYNVPDGYGFTVRAATYKTAGDVSGSAGLRELGSYGKRGPAGPVGAPADSPGKLKVAVYAITKNEEKFVDRWMDSMSEADGVYVLDTGSTDSTVERLKARGAHVESKVYDPWRFDKSRNDSMALCPADTDIYVCTDLDEVLEKGWRAKLEAAWLGYEKAHGSRPARAHYDYIWGWEADGRTPRVKFRYEKIHDGNYEWRYPVHELLFRKDETRPDSHVETDILLEHHPDGAKPRNYLPLLELAVSEDPSNGRNVHYLAREYSFCRNWPKAIEWHKRYLDMKGQWSAERAVSMKWLGVAYWHTGRRDEAELWFRRGMEEAPGQREAASAWAECLERAGMWKEAAKVLLRMVTAPTKKGPTNYYVTELSAWGAPAYDRLGIALWKAGSRDEARTVYEAAVRKFPGDAHIKGNLARCGDSALGRFRKQLDAAWPRTGAEQENEDGGRA